MADRTAFRTELLGVEYDTASQASVLLRFQLGSTVKDTSQIRGFNVFLLINDRSVTAPVTVLEVNPRLSQRLDIEEDKAKKQLIIRSKSSVSQPIALKAVVDQRLARGLSFHKGPKLGEVEFVHDDFPSVPGISFQLFNPDGFDIPREYKVLLKIARSAAPCDSSMFKFDLMIRGRIASIVPLGTPLKMPRRWRDTKPDTISVQEPYRIDVVQGHRQKELGLVEAWKMYEDNTIKDPFLLADSSRARGALLESRARGVEIKLSQKRKWFLLFSFSVAQASHTISISYLDIMSYSGLFVFTNQILTDLDILYEASSWIITAYIITSAAFLLFWGRVSDLYSPKPVFLYGFAGLGITNLIISFMPNQYAYFVFRAISGIFGAATIMSANRLIPAIFEPSELQVAWTLFALAIAIANLTSLAIAGCFGFIKGGGQMAAWRWFFRGICIIIVPFASAAAPLMPETKGDRQDECHSEAERFKRLDLVGCFSMLVSIVLFNLGLTLGASYGFKTAKFLVPFLLAWLIFVAFFFWEANLPDGYALIPSATWRIPNLTLFIIFALGISPWWAVNQLPLVERFIAVFGEQPIIAAVRMLPQGIAAIIIAMFIPSLISNLGSARWPIAIGMLLGAAAYALMIFVPNGDIYNDQYWRWYFPAFIIGSAGAMMSFLGTNITVMTSVPPGMSLVAGSLLQVSLQVGAGIGLSVQAGFLTINPGSVTNYANIQASFWFQYGWCVFNLVIFLAFFRPGKEAPGSAAPGSAATQRKPASATAV